MALNPSRFIDPNINKQIVFLSETQKAVSEAGWNIDFYSHDVDEKDFSIDLRSDSKKVVVKLFPSFFHFYTEQFAALLFIHDLFKDIEVIVIDCLESEERYLEELFLQFNMARMAFFIFLDDLKIKYKVFTLKEIDRALINNHVLCDNFIITDGKNQGTYLFNLSQKYVIKQNKTNKAYVRTGRVKNEHLLETYLKQYDFDIITSQSFNNFFEQINYYYNTKVLISATAGSFVNICFMQENANIIELVTPVKQYTPESTEYNSCEIHHIYDTLCFQRNIPYAAIINEDTTAEEIIDKIERTAFLKCIIKQNE